MDFITDNNPKPLYAALTALGDFPDYVSKQAVFTEEDTAALADSAFVDPVRRELPIHCKAAAFLSAATYFNEKTSRPSNAESILLQAAEHYGIEADFEKLAATGLRNIPDTAEPEPIYAILVDSVKVAGVSSDKPIGVYRIDTIHHMLKSAFQMEEDARLGYLPLKQFREGAMRCVKLARAGGVYEELPPEVRRVGEDRLPDFELAESVAILRKYAGCDEDTVAIYKDIVKAASSDYKESGYDPGALERWIDAWVELDNRQGVKYSRMLIDPYRAFFSGIPTDEVDKMAATNVVLRDVMIPVTDFSAVPESAIKFSFAEGTAAEILQIQKTAAADTAEASVRLSGLDEKVQKRLLRIVADS